MLSGADISLCGTWRYSLERAWNYQLKLAAWVCLNPSMADQNIDDPTVRKITGFTARLGYGGFVLSNVLALRATDPQQLLKHFNPRGPLNDPESIRYRCARVSPDPPIIAWGAINKKFYRDALEVIRALGIARCFGYTKEGHPRHPLMLPYSTKIQMTDTSHFFNVYLKGKSKSVQS